MSHGAPVGLFAHFSEMESAEAGFLEHRPQRNPRGRVRREEGAASLAPSPGVLFLAWPEAPPAYLFSARGTPPRGPPSVTPRARVENEGSTRFEDVDMLRLMARPRSIPEGGTLGIFAASGPFERSRLAPGRARLESRQLQLVEAPALAAREGFLAGTDTQRVEGLLSLLDRNDVHGLIAARGGYGLTRILGRLPPERFEAAGKWLIGFSDVTALHAHLAPHLQTIHAPVLTQLGGLDETVADDLRAILGGALGPTLTADGPELSPGVAEGRLWGGNLAVLTALCGTPYLRPPEAPIILLLEDVGETTYRLDRMLTQLLDSGALSNVRGVALGDFHDCHPAQAHHPTVLEVLKERLAGLGVPILAGLPIGHGSRNAPVVLGAPYRLDAPRGRLEPLS